MTDNTDRNEKFSRWQGITMTQLSYSINLFLTFSVASLGFCVSLLFNENLNTSTCQVYFYFHSLFLILASGGFGVWCTINRLRDFRASAKIANLKRKKNNSKPEKVDDCEIDTLRELTKNLGNKTWIIFWWQIGTFCAGIVLLVLSVAFSVCKMHL